MKMIAVDETAVKIVQALLFELATELDLHYEDEDFHALTPSIRRIEVAVEYLVKLDKKVPPEVEHVLRRYRRSSN